MKTGLYWLRLSGTGVLLGWVFYVLDWQAMFDTLAGISLLLFLTALVISALTTVAARAVLVWLLVDPDERPPLIRCVETYFSLRFFSVALPRPIVVGLRIRRLNTLCGKSTAFAIGLMTYEALSGALIMAFGAALFYLLQTDRISWSPVIPYVFLCLLGLVASFALLFTRRLDLLINRLLTLLPPQSRIRTRMQSGLKFWRDTVGGFIRRGRSTLVTTLVFAIIFYAGFILSAYVLYLAMGTSLPPAELAWSRSAVWLITVLPISIGGLGVREVGLAFVMADFGVDFETAVAYGFLSFILQTMTGLLGGIVEIKDAFVSGSQR